MAPAAVERNRKIGVVQPDRFENVLDRAGQAFRPIDEMWQRAALGEAQQAMRTLAHGARRHEKRGGFARGRSLHA
jgi:hypothetical protein